LISRSNNNPVTDKIGNNYLAGYKDGCVFMFEAEVFPCKFRPQNVCT